MAEDVRSAGGIRPGDIFEDCRFHPCFCYDTGDDGDAVLAYHSSMARQPPGSFLGPPRRVPAPDAGGARRRGGADE
jgi:hypothetical protein